LSSFLLSFTLLAAAQSGPEAHAPGSAPLLGYTSKTSPDEQLLEK
jgi:hypothetical protein